MRIQEKLIRENIDSSIREKSRFLILETLVMPTKTHPKTWNLRSTFSIDSHTTAVLYQHRIRQTAINDTL